MFKDKKNINHRNKATYRENIGKLSGAIKKGNDYLNGLLLEGQSSLGKPHKDNHNGCTYKKNPSVEKPRVTEKRICRCMYYYNNDNDETQIQKCASCEFTAKWKKDKNSDYEIIDYEVPMKDVWEKVGGIDLLLKDKDNNIYATEVKPEKSKETIVRMVAEILTYCEILKYEYEISDYKLGISDDKLEKPRKIIPSICFFKDSLQWTDYNKTYKEDEDFKVLMDNVKVFCITHTDTTYKFEKLN